MSKWADFCISEVRYDSEHTHIIKVKVHTDLGESIGPSTESTRTEVVTAIGSGKTFVSITRATDVKCVPCQSI